MFYSCEKSILRKKPGSSLEKFPSLVLPRNTIMLQQLTIPSFICQVVAYSRLKTKENFKLLALEVVVVTCKRFQM